MRGPNLGDHTRHPSHKPNHLKKYRLLSSHTRNQTPQDNPWKLFFQDVLRDLSTSATKTEDFLNHLRNRHQVLSENYMSHHLPQMYHIFHILRSWKRLFHHHLVQCSCSRIWLFFPMSPSWIHMYFPSSSPTQAEGRCLEDLSLQQVVLFSLDCSFFFAPVKLV